MKKIINGVMKRTEEENEKTMREKEMVVSEVDFVDEKGKVRPLSIAEDILDCQRIVTLRDNEEMFYYNNGIYHNNAKSLIKEMSQNRVKWITSHSKKEVIELIKGLTYIDREDLEKNKHLLHLKNGVFNFETMEMENFSPDKISITQIPIKYDPKADCPKIKQFIKDVVGEDQIDIAQEMFGYCLKKDYIYNKAFMCFGNGRNGKTTFLNLLTRFLGQENISIVSLQDLLYNRFAKQKLYGKLANIYDDLPNKQLTSTGNFKILTGRGRIWADVKFQNGFEFQNYAKLIFSCNELPKTEDTTYAFFRRWILLKFDNRFEGEKEDPNIEEKITTEEELSGLFNWALEGLKRIIKQGGFSETHTTNDLKTEWVIRTDPMRAFVETEIELDSNSFITKDMFAQKLNEFCEENNTSTLTKQYIGQNLPSIIPQVKQKRIRVDGNLERVWSGIKFSSGDSSDNSSTGNNRKLDRYESCNVDIDQKNTKKSEKKSTMTEIQPFSYSKKFKNNIIYKEGLDIFGYLSQKDVILKILDKITENGITYFELEQKCIEEKVVENEDQFLMIIDKLKEEGKIFEPRAGFLKKL